MNWVFLNGDFVKGETAATPALDRGLLYGYGLFETMRSYGGCVFRLEAHYRRLFESAVTLDIPSHLTFDGLRTAIDILLEKNGLPDARIRLTLTAGTMSEPGKARPVAIDHRRAAHRIPDLALRTRHVGHHERRPPQRDVAAQPRQIAQLPGQPADTGRGAAKRSGRGDLVEHAGDGRRGKREQRLLGQRRAPLDAEPRFGRSAGDHQGGSHRVGGGSGHRLCGGRSRTGRRCPRQRRHS